jgi:hypothetical protein
MTVAVVVHRDHRAHLPGTQAGDRDVQGAPVALRARRHRGLDRPRDRGARPGVVPGELPGSARPQAQHGEQRGRDQQQPAGTAGRPQVGGRGDALEQLGGRRDDHRFEVLARDPVEQGGKGRELRQLRGARGAAGEVLVDRPPLSGLQSTEDVGAEVMASRAGHEVTPRSARASLSARSA